MLSVKVWQPAKNDEQPLEIQILNKDFNNMISPREARLIMMETPALTVK